MNDSSQALPRKPTVESTSVQNYLNILQGIITRMATNSSNCKTWCVSLVSAILVVIADKDKPDYAWIALIPIFLFLLLDSYYLGQERNFRCIYNDFVKKLRDNTVEVSDLFVLKPPRGLNVVTALFKAIFSFSIYPFYLTLLATVIIARYLIL